MLQSRSITETGMKYTEGEAPLDIASLHDQPTFLKR